MDVLWKGRAEVGVSMRALETQLAKIRKAFKVQAEYDTWDRWGASNATLEERAAKDAEYDAASREMAEAKAQLESLVVAARADAPAEIDAWVDAHDAYLVEYIEECLARGATASTEVHVARTERAQWAEVRAGTRFYVEENHYYVPMNAARYGRLFGIDPYTLEPVS